MAKIAFTGASGGDGSEVASNTSQHTTTIVLAATSDNPISLQITSFKMNGRNFLQWSRSVQMVIRGKGKFGYLDRSIPRPAPSDPSYPTWDIHNSMVMSWLIHSMENNIGEIYLLYPTARAIWDAISLAYFVLQILLRCFLYVIVLVIYGNMNFLSLSILVPSANCGKNSTYLIR